MKNHLSTSEVLEFVLPRTLATPEARGEVLALLRGELAAMARSMKMQLSEMRQQDNALEADVLDEKLPFSRIRCEVKNGLIIVEGTFRKNLSWLVHSMAGDALHVTASRMLRKLFEI